jgi:hypothetical protein
MQLQQILACLLHSSSYLVHDGLNVVCPAAAANACAVMLSMFKAKAWKQRNVLKRSVPLGAMWFDSWSG